jgi:hypothetical protein
MASTPTRPARYVCRTCKYVCNEVLTGRDHSQRDCAVVLSDLQELNGVLGEFHGTGLPGAIWGGVVCSVSWCVLCVVCRVSCIVYCVLCVVWCVVCGVRCGG